jgi:hypothetical protein
MITTGMLTPSPIFAPMGKPFEDSIYILVVVGKLKGLTGIERDGDTVVACGFIVMKEARASTVKPNCC